jgi:PAS domain-containing protein
MAAATLAGCASFATHEEYGRYRAVRLAADERERMVAMQQYVEHHSDGIWATEIQAQRGEREEELWTRSAASREGLEWYLQVYPDGRYVDQARPRLDALRHVENTAEQQAAAERELRDQQRDAAAAERRVWVTRAVQFWTRTLVGLDGFGNTIGRIARGNPEFARAFGQTPEPTCTPAYCIKHYGQLYHIPVPGSTRIDRSIDVYLRLVLTNGRVRRAEILLPNSGFSRWYEMENGEVVTDEDPQQRYTAINWALERIQPVILEVAQGAQQIDLVPEPVERLEVQTSAQEAAPPPPDEAAPPPSDRPADPAVPSEQGSLDALLDEAAGAEQPQQPQQPQRAETEETVFPIHLVAYLFNNLRVSVFAAGEGDYGEGYDGVVIEIPSED